MEEMAGKKIRKGEMIKQMVLFNLSYLLPWSVGQLANGSCDWFGGVLEMHVLAPGLSQVYSVAEANCIHIHLLFTHM